MTSRNQHSRTRRLIAAAQSNAGFTQRPVMKTQTDTRAAPRACRPRLGGAQILLARMTLQKGSRVAGWGRSQRLALAPDYALLHGLVSDARHRQP